MRLLYSVEKIGKVLEEELEKKSEEVTAKIKETLSYNYYNEIELLDYTVFVQSFCLSIVLFSMDRDTNEVFYEGEDKGIFSDSVDIINEFEYFENDSEEFWGFYDKNDENISKIETKVLVKWFEDCWRRAKGNTLSLPTYFSFHDVDECYDLTNSKWVTDGDKWTS